MQYSTKKLAENKLIILHLLQKMGISLSNSEICQFLLEKYYMDYFSIQQYLSELETAGWLEKTREQNNTRNTLTDDGEEVMNYFISRISDDVKNEINTYVRENNKRIRAEYAVTANYFPLVVFSPADAMSGNFAPVAVSYSGGVYIYAESKPAEAVTIPNIVCLPLA